MFECELSNSVVIESVNVEKCPTILIEHRRLGVIPMKQFGEQSGQLNAPEN
jgi:hypothetical protein